MLDQQTTGGMGKVDRESSHHWVAIYRLPETYFRCLAVDSVVARIVVLWQALWLYESYLAIHSFFALKIADTTILYARRVLKTFNRYLNRKREFTMITGKIWCSVRKFDTLFSIIYSWYRWLLDILQCSQPEMNVLNFQFCHRLTNLWMLKFTCSVLLSPWG